ncbi:hypothetical protein SM139_2490, partial [Stenotrophomonas maltophilia]
TMPTPCATRSAPPASALLSSRCAPKRAPCIASASGRWPTVAMPSS